MVTHGGTLHGWLRIGGSGGLLFVAYTLCRVKGFDDDDDIWLQLLLLLLFGFIGFLKIIYDVNPKQHIFFYLEDIGTVITFQNIVMIISLSVNKLGTFEFLLFFLTKSISLVDLG